MMVLLLVNFTYAGGEITDEIIKSCENGTQAESCRLLAEESKCGVGFNSDTAMYLGMACEINKNIKPKTKTVISNDSPTPTSHQVASIN